MSRISAVAGAFADLCAVIFDPFADDVWFRVVF